MFGLCGELQFEMQVSIWELNDVSGGLQAALGNHSTSLQATGSI